jgi:flavodoxin
VPVLIVVDSVYGNTERLARVIGDELAKTFRVRIARPSSLERLPEDASLIVIGAPTHRHGVPASISDLLHASPAGSMPGTPAAAFDTRYRIPRLLSGASSDPVARRLRRLGCRLALPPESFFVSGREGPLEEGEVERAAAWAARLCSAVRRLPALAR